MPSKIIITGRAFREQCYAIYGPNEFIFPEYRDDEIISAALCCKVKRISDAKERSVGVQNVLDGLCLHFKHIKEIRRSVLVKKWLLQPTNANVEFIHFAYHGMNVNSVFFCTRHSRTYILSPNAFGSDPRCPQCRDKVDNPDSYWFDVLPGNIQTRHNGDEYIVPGTSYQIDGFCKESNTIYEYNGCFSHSCPVCDYADRKYSSTQAKKIDCIERGYNYVDMPHCIWSKMRNSKKAIKDYKKTMYLLYKKRVEEFNERKETESRDSAPSIWNLF